MRSRPKARDAPVFLLTGSIEYVEERHLVVNHALLAIRIFDGLRTTTESTPGGKVVRVGCIIVNDDMIGKGRGVRDGDADGNGRAYRVISETSKRTGILGVSRRNERVKGEGERGEPSQSQSDGGTHSST